MDITCYFTAYSLRCNQMWGKKLGEFIRNFYGDGDMDVRYFYGGVRT